MVREFDGTDDSIKFPMGGMLGTDAGPLTVAVVAKAAAVGNRVMVGGAFGDNTHVWKFQGRSEANNPVALNVSGGSHCPGTATTQQIVANGWGIWSCAKAAGSDAPLIGRYLFTGSSFASESSGTASGDGNALNVGDYLVVGRDGPSSEFFQGRIATIGLWNLEMSLAQLQEFHAVLATDSWYTHSAGVPRILWDFNQADVATDVLDLTGGGATETAITGTTVVSGDDPPGWVFGLAPPVWRPSYLNFPKAILRSST